MNRIDSFTPGIAGHSNHLPDNTVTGGVYMLFTRLLALLFVAFVAGCSGGTGGGASTLGGATVTVASIAVTPGTSIIPVNGTQQFIATATLSDGTTSDVTALSTWVSASVGVATVVSTTGAATGVAVGTSLITATFGGKSGATNLTATSTAATLTSITVTPATPSIPVSGIKQFKATATYSDGSTLDVTAVSTWNSATVGVATIVSTTGLASGVTAGTTLITATYTFGGITKSGTTNLTVSAATLSGIAVTPAAPSIPISGIKQFIATATYSDASTLDVTATSIWSSATTGVATIVSASGLANGIAVGSSVITASYGGKTATSTLTVTAATLSSIAVTPTTFSIPVAGTKHFVATATYSDATTLDITATSSWSSATTGVATVVATTGIATGIAAGTSVITASYGGKTATSTLTVTAATLSSIAVTPATFSIPVAGTKQFTATATYSDATTLDVTATSTWVSATPSVATVVLNTGLASGVTVGTSVITASYGGKSGTATLTVTAALATNPTAPTLGEAGRFVLLAYTAITTTGTTAISNGDIGITPTARTGMTGFTPSGAAGNFVELTGTTWPGVSSTSYAPADANPAPFPYPLHYSTPVVGAPWTTSGAMLTQASSDLTTAYNFLAAATNPTIPVPAACPTQLGGLTLTRNVYLVASDVLLTTGTLTLDAQGDPNSVFIFTITGKLTTGAPGGSIALINGAQAKNVYFRTSGITTIAAGTTFYGNVFAFTQINVLSGANITGSLLAVNQQVTLISDIITKAP